MIEEEKVKQIMDERLSIRMLEIFLLVFLVGGMFMMFENRIWNVEMVVGLILILIFAIGWAFIPEKPLDRK